MRRVALVLVATLALFGAACSSDGNGGGSAYGGGMGSSDGCTEANAVDLSGDNPFTITIGDFAFQPNCVKAASASSITIVNNDSVSHTFTIDGTQVDVTIPAGETFNGESAGLAPGTYEFYCSLHPDMTGTIFVV
ncbi:MAG: cupredoxin domain-containing protein [Actinomycetota bacterium]